MLDLIAAIRAHRLRRRARKLSREWLQELEKLGSDWDAAGVLWQFIAAWLAHDPMHSAVFLPAFRQWAVRQRRTLRASRSNTQHTKRVKTAGIILGVLLALCPVLALTQASNADMNAANNPLQPTLGANIQDQYIARYYGLGDADSNALLLRGTLPHKLFGLPQLTRLTVPIVTSPDLPEAGRDSALGDLSLFDLFLTKLGAMEVGLGPQLTAPTASHDTLGSGKWQAGVAAVAIAPRKWGLAGGLITWQHSFAGESARVTQNNLTAQPFFILNLPQGLYLRSTATWTWDLHLGTHYIPIGTGVGKVWKIGSTVLNAFAEPQWTVAHHGEGIPSFQVFFGVNLQFPLPGTQRRSQT